MNTFRSLSENRSFISLWLLFLLLSTFIPVCDAESVSETRAIDQHLNLNPSFHEYTNAVRIFHSDRTDTYCCEVFSAQANELPLILHSSSLQDVWVTPVDFSPPGVITPALYRLPDDWQEAHFRAARLPVYLLTRRLRI